MPAIKSGQTSPTYSAVPSQARRGRGAGLRVLNVGVGRRGHAIPMVSMVFTVIAASAQMGLEIRRERITDSVAKGRAAARTSADGVRPSPTLRSATRYGSLRAGSRPPSTGASGSCPARPLVQLVTCRRRCWQQRGRRQANPGRHRDFDPDRLDRAWLPRTGRGRFYADLRLHP